MMNFSAYATTKDEIHGKGNTLVRPTLQRHHDVRCQYYAPLGPCTSLLLCDLRQPPNQSHKYYSDHCNPQIIGGQILPAFYISLHLQWLDRTREQRTGRQDRSFFTTSCQQLACESTFYLFNTSKSIKFQFRLALPALERKLSSLAACL